MVDLRNPAPVPEEGTGTAAATPAVAPAPLSQSDAGIPAKEAGNDWRTGLPDNIRRAAEKFESPADVVKSYAALERRLGKSVTIPDPNATPAEIDAFYARIGRPETPEEYDVHIPDDLPAHLRPDEDAVAGRSEFLTAMHEAGATPAVVQAAFNWYYGALARGDGETKRREESVRAEAEAELKRDWGTTYDRNIELARRAARHYGGDDLLTALERAGLADDPVCLRAFSGIGATMVEDGVLTGDASPTGNAQQRIDRLMTDHFGKPSYANAGVQDELRQLYQNVYGTASAPSSSA